jgi:hypothetical protein
VGEPVTVMEFNGPKQIILGKWERMIKAYGQLAGIEVAPI